MRSDEAETAALAALGWLVAQDDLIATFLGVTGASEADLRTRAAEPEFLASVLDFILMDDVRVLDWAAAAGRRPEDMAWIRARLPGGDSPDWT